MAVAALLTILAAVLVWQLLDQRAAGRVLDRRIAVARAAVAAKKPPPPPNKAETEQNKRWAALRTERAFAWAPLFNALESAGNPDIELLEFHPDKTSSTVLLRGEAKDEAALLDFIDRLSHSPAMRHVYLSHRKLRKRDRLVTLTFELKAEIAVH